MTAIAHNHTRPTVADYMRDLVLGERNTHAMRVVTKASVGGVSTADPNYSPLAELEGAYEFRTYVERRLLPAKLDAAWRLPFFVRSAIETTGATAAWAAEGAPMPAAGFVASSVRLEASKVGVIVSITSEMAQSRGSDSNAGIIRIVGSAIARRVNATFASAAAAAAGAPAGVAFGASTVPSTGTSAIALQADLNSLVELADASGADLTQASWILSPARAVAIASALSIDTLGLRGGTLLGAPALTDPGAGDEVLLVDGSRVAVAIGGINIDSAEHASIEQLDNPTNSSATPTPTTLVSMWQSNSVAIRARLAVNWAAADDAVFVITETV